MKDSNDFVVRNVEENEHLQEENYTREPGVFE